MKTFIIISFSVAIVFIGIMGVIAFGGPTRPESIKLNERFQNIDWSQLTPKKQYLARDGVKLSYRNYHPTITSPKNEIKLKGSVVLVHGSSANNASMMALALALSSDGYDVYALDVRGHGDSGVKGQISYIGQLEDDVADFMAVINPPKPSTLLGFSAGGGFALRFAASYQQNIFQSYLLMSPFLSQSAPTYRPDSGGWVNVGLPRVFALMLLNHIGIKWFNDLDVVAYAVDDDPYANLTGAYSYNLSQNFRPHADYISDVKAVRAPMMLMVGANDDQFFAEHFAPFFANANPEIKAEIVPNIDHIGLILDEKSVKYAVKLVNQLNAEKGQ